jgi:SHS family lactate transporter-like MFS transporter
MRTTTMALSSAQKKVILAAFLGWMLDAFDFFLLVFALPSIAASFGVGVPTVAYAIFLTLALRLVGAFAFGRLGDRYGRRPVLMVDVVCYSVLGALAAFAPSLTVFLVLRALFGAAMGGEWGLGAALTMESVPPSWRGRVSGILQCGYPAGYLLAAIVFGAFYGTTWFGVTIGWRQMFLFSLLPAGLVLYIRSHVAESPAFESARGAPRPAALAALRSNWRVALYAVVLMTFFNLFSHGTQDLYPVFLQKQHGFAPHTVSVLTVVANLGAIAGGLLFGAWSERIGRRNAISIAALLVLPAIPLWAYASTPALLALGAFTMQLAVQGAWGVVPVHLNELSPGVLRATMPGFVYQAGNLLASYNAPLQARLAEAPGHSYGSALAWWAGVVAVAVALLIRFSPERRGTALQA